MRDPFETTRRGQQVDNGLLRFSASLSDGVDVAFAWNACRINWLDWRSRSSDGGFRRAQPRAAGEDLHAAGLLRQVGRTLIARDSTTTSVTSEIQLSTVISILARWVYGSASVGLNAVAVL